MYLRLKVFFLAGIDRIRYRYRVYNNIIIRGRRNPVDHDKDFEGVAEMECRRICVRAEREYEHIYTNEREKKN